MANFSNYGVVLVTAASQAEAETIAEALIQERLAACVNIVPIQSLYVWQGEMHRDQEYQLIIKTNLDRFSELESKIQAIHSYEIPEIIALPIIKGSAPYLQWMSDQIKSD
ncbi:MAG: divalent-cation tolerance protein CutA [Elainellaceae cyanobacterium]